MCGAWPAVSSARANRSSDSALGADLPLKENVRLELPLGRTRYPTRPTVPHNEEIEPCRPQELYAKSD